MTLQQQHQEHEQQQLQQHQPKLVFTVEHGNARDKDHIGEKEEEGEEGEDQELDLGNYGELGYAGNSSTSSSSSSQSQDLLLPGDAIAVAEAAAASGNWARWVGVRV
jgi:hypothetical protein